MGPTDSIEEEADRLIRAAGGGESAGELENLADGQDRLARGGGEAGGRAMALALELRRRVLLVRAAEPRGPTKR